MFTRSKRTLYSGQMGHLALEARLAMKVTTVVTLFKSSRRVTSAALCCVLALLISLLITQPAGAVNSHPASQKASQVAGSSHAVAAGHQPKRAAALPAAAAKAQAAAKAKAAAKAQASARAQAAARAKAVAKAAARAQAAAKAKVAARPAPAQLAPGQNRQSAGSATLQPAQDARAAFQRRLAGAARLVGWPGADDRTLPIVGRLAEQAAAVAEKLRQEAQKAAQQAAEAQRAAQAQAEAARRAAQQA